MPQVSLGGPFLPPQLFLLPFLLLPSMDQWGLVVLQGRESLGRAGGAGLPHLGPAWKERGGRGSDGHEVDFCAGVAFWEGCGHSGFEFTQPKPVVMISLCSLFLKKKKRVCVTRKPQMFMVNFLSTEDDASKKHIKKYHTM